MAEKRFSPAAEEVLRLAYEAAAERKSSYVGCEHLLLGQLRRGRGLAYRLLCEAGASELLVRGTIEQMGGQGKIKVPLQGLSEQARNAVEMAAAEAIRGNSVLIEAEHLLLGMLRNGEDNPAVRILSAAGIDTKRLYITLLRRQNEERDGTVRRDMLTRTAREAAGKREKGLSEYTCDLTAMARCGKLDPVIGRDAEIERVIGILSRRRKNNPVLLGEPGVGKTAVAEGLAERIAMGDAPEELLGKRLLSLDLAGMVAGTKYRGDFEDRVRNLLDEVKRDGNVILFIDELHTIVGAGSAEGAVDAANLIKPVLGRGEIRVIGATTLREYRKHIEKDAALERRFQPVMVAEPTPEQTLEILRGLREKYEGHHRLHITEEALSAAVELSRRYIHDRSLPDKAIDLVDEAASYVRIHKSGSSAELRALEEKMTALRREKAQALAAQDLQKAAQLRDIEQDYRVQAEQERASLQCSSMQGEKSVTQEDIAAVVSMWTGIPTEKLSEGESARLIHLEESLQKRIVGQREAVSAVARAIRRSRVGIRDPKRPIGSFLFLGPTGVGKTELCKALAETMFGAEDAMVRLDMTEYSEKHSLSRLIGAPPGYVGYDEGGQLTEKVRRKPYSVVLFDEIEKAHEDIWDLLLQITEDGMVTDAQGRQVDFKNTIIIMTSNLGAKNITDGGARLGFASSAASDRKREEETREAVMEQVRRVFKPEFLNRIDESIVFRQLDEQDIAQIARRLLRATQKRAEALGITLDASQEAIERLAAEGYDRRYGARPLRQSISAVVEDRVAELLLEGSVRSGQKLCLCVVDGELCVCAERNQLSCAAN